MTKVIIKEGLAYTASNNRMKYHPDFHENHGRSFKEEEKAYMCAMWESTKKADIAMALGRTHGTVLSQAYTLRKQGLFDYYKRLGKAL